MCSSRWTRYDWAINEASKANNLDAFIDNIKIKKNGKSRRNKARANHHRFDRGVNRGRAAGVVASSAV